MCKKLSMVVFVVLLMLPVVAQAEGVDYFIGHSWTEPTDSDSPIDYSSALLLSPRIDLGTHDWQLAGNFGYHQANPFVGSDEDIYSFGVSIIRNFQLDGLTIAPEVGADWNVLDADGIDDRWTYKGLVSFKMPMGNHQFVLAVGYQFDEGGNDRLFEGTFGQVGMIFQTQ